MKQSLVHLRATFKTKEEAWIQFRFEKIYFDIESRHRAKNPGGGKQRRKIRGYFNFYAEPRIFRRCLPPPDFLPKVDFWFQIYTVFI